jgi:hypothetical protein
MENGETTENEPKKRAVSPINGQPVPNGRIKGVPNKATTRFKEALNKLFEDNADQMMSWLAQVDNPKDRFDILSKFVEILYPKLARQEHQNLDSDGKPADPPKVIVEIVRKAITDT